MPGGLAALLDDVALIAKTAAASVDDVAAAAAKTSTKAAGVVIDDAAVTPRFVQGVTPARELPIIWRITKGSLFNKLIIILPIALLLNAIAPWLLTPILMLGGTYLAFEGAEKVWEHISGHHHGEDDDGPKDENALVRGAITTDLILSAEIMVISLNEVADQSIWMEAAVLFTVAIAVTVAVYGAVGFLVKMDDLGLKMMAKDSSTARRFGRGLVQAMPKILSVIAFIGMLAMLWVGGHILLVGADELGLHAPYHFVHGLAEKAHHLGGFVMWLIETFFSLITGLIVGAIVVVIMHLIPRKNKH
ncbi:DUF808 domain-containing protein [Corynebacterium felinum]|uniref:DNA repair protein MutK n=1 Tax=Corynebacterium felinum TaxID=131318 RepID=A0ABU2BA06_9CORY|nr:DUF808 domain-containing protein [Corynebacterium felinum]MDF5821274.1 DUF808 domain-containing protein [Corynebacterium felinum]MDR7355206.1 putative DNA repair protein MutK [Corynebacterium felinum]WJY94557.1 Inner membrane protein YedI [Corynebacterium felinum]